MFIKSVFKNINCISINNIVQQRTPRFYYHTHSETLLTYVFITERRGGGGLINQITQMLMMMI